MMMLTGELAPLAQLQFCRRSPAEYFAPFLTSDDEILKVGAWSVLLDRNDVTPGQYPAVLEMAHYGAIWRKAFVLFESICEHSLAAQVAAISPRNEAAADALWMRAALDFDASAVVSAQRLRFLATGRLDILLAMIDAQELAAGWQSAVPSAVKAMLVFPHEPSTAAALLSLLHNGRQAAMINAIVNTLNANQLHPLLAAAYAAAARLHAGQADRCLAILSQIAAAPAQRSSVTAGLQPLVARLRAEALEKLGRYRDAYVAYVGLNGIERGGETSLDEWPRMVTESAALALPPMERDSFVNHFVMTGFARSGTTLLENALGMHRQIETFEEIPSRASMQIHLERTLPTATTPPLLEAALLEARRRFYDEAMRRSHKAEATIFIDKSPMRSADAGFMVKLFPDKRYIFSIRHPFDVVLSCFKQNFTRNAAMEHFRSFDTAVKLYDFTMTQWFGVFSMDDPRVHYVRYDTLVTEFEPTLRGVLGFLGAEWDDAVLDFASAAEKRSNRTPSYQKVRQGLSIGVQTSWRNYDFLFQSPDAKPLYKWAEFFGYPTK